MKLLIEKLEIEIVPEEQKNVTEYLLERENQALLHEREGGASRLSVVSAFLPILMQAFDKILGQGVKFDLIDPSQVHRPGSDDDNAPPDDDNSPPDDANDPTDDDETCE